MIRSTQVSTPTPPATRISQRLLLGGALASIAFAGACALLAVGAGISSCRDDAGDRAAAAANPEFQRALVSTSGRVLFVAQQDGTDDFYVSNVDGSGLTRLTNVRPGSIFAGPPAVSPDRTRLAISAGGISIVRLDRPGESLQLDRPGGSLAWSPDGTALASLSIDDHKRLHLHVFNADGSGEVRSMAETWPPTASGDHQFVGDLVWSPDATRFAFVLRTRPGYRRSGPSHTHLYVASADGTRLTNLSLAPDAGLVDGGLAWAPDGRRLAFRAGDGIGTVDVDLKWTLIRIEPHGSRSSQHPAWSPDGTRLAWFSPHSIVTSQPDGERQEELTRGRCRGVHPSWSDDGSRIAFVCHDWRDQGNVFAMNADGSGLTQVTNLAGGTWPFAASAYIHPKFPVWLP
jgi:Tol biopolymer transport system component